MTTYSRSDIETFIEASGSHNDLLKQALALLEEREALELAIRSKGVPSDSTSFAVKHVVALTYGVSTDDIDGPDRSGSIVQARREVMWRLRQFTRRDGKPRYTLAQIGKLVGGRDHTTARSAILAHQEHIAQQEAA